MWKQIRERHSEVRLGKKTQEKDKLTFKEKCRE